ncbi:MAG TPA: hypothetical protein VG712_03735 [Gemmatimonadales bacterium]|nr:hypothetical protein [Gemmatimonadales bacterium]
MFPDIRAAARVGGTSIVLSAPAPALHLRTDQGAVKEWGVSGDGPGEFRDPVDLFWGTDGGVVLDRNAHRLTAYDAGSRLRWSHFIGGDWADRIRIVRGDTLMHLFEPMGVRRAVVRVRGSRRDTLFRYADGGDLLQFERAGIPALTVRGPFLPSTRWTDVPGRGIATWVPGDSVVRLRDLNGIEFGRLPIPAVARPVLAADREWWFRLTFEQAFLGRTGLFRGHLADARRRVVFPDRFAPVTGLLGGDDGAVWVRRTSPGAGEEWVAIGLADSMTRRVVLPPGREALAFTRDLVLTRAIDEDDLPVLEGWRLP